MVGYFIRFLRRVFSQRFARVKALASFLLFLASFITSIGAVTVVEEGRPPTVEIPLFRTIQHGENYLQNTCMVVYPTRNLVFTLTPEAVLIAILLGLLFSFNVLVLLRLRLDRLPIRGGLVLFSTAWVLALLSSSSCWIACCSGGLLLLILAPLLPVGVLSALIEYSKALVLPSTLLFITGIVVGYVRVRKSG